MKKLIFLIMLSMLYIAMPESQAQKWSSKRPPKRKPKKDIVADSLEYKALKDLYTATTINGNWKRDKNWLNGTGINDIKKWHGVIVWGGDVRGLILINNNLSGEIPATIGHLKAMKGLLLSSNKLTGEVPAEILNLTGLKMIRLNHNQLTGFPDFSSYPNVDDLVVQLNNNNLDFGDLELLFMYPGKSIFKHLDYRNQGKIGEEQEVKFREGKLLEISVSTAGNNNTYQWQKLNEKYDESPEQHGIPKKGKQHDKKWNPQNKKWNPYDKKWDRHKDKKWIDIEGADQPVYQVPTATAEDAGTYRCLVKNDLVTRLTLTTKEYHVEMEEYFEAIFVLDTREMPANLSYEIMGPELSGTYSFGTYQEFIIPDPEDTSTILLNVLSDSISVGLGYKFNVDTEGNIDDVMLVSGMDNFALNQQLFQVQGSQLSLMPLRRRSGLWPEFNMILEDGLVMSPNGDGYYDELILEGIDDVQQFSLTINDLTNQAVYTTADKNIPWDGTNSLTNEVVSAGVYRYILEADGVVLKGQFLVEF